MIKKFVLENKEELIKLRREFHRYPEIGFKEFKTSKMISDYLEELGLDVKKGIAGTGVVADINTHIDDYTVALRFDIDGLPVKEETGLDYSSKNEGTMHACGHDGHITVGLGMAKLLCEIGEFIPARIRLIFQPAEEGLGGAKKMVEEGVLKDPVPNLIIGFHIWPYLKTGEVGFKSGPVMAAGDEFHIKLLGKGSHGSSPHLAVDPILMAAEFIQGLQKIVSRNISSSESAVISIGTIEGGSSFNIIPSDIKLSGTVRVDNTDLREFIKEKMENVLKGVTLGSGGEYEFSYESCFKLTTSCEELVDILYKSICESLGEDKAIHLKNCNMTSEDFSEYEEYIPGLYFFLGTGNEEKDCIYPLHNPSYRLDEDTLTTGIIVLGTLLKNISNVKAMGGK